MSVGLFYSEVSTGTQQTYWNNSWSYLKGSNRISRQEEDKLKYSANTTYQQTKTDTLASASGYSTQCLVWTLPIVQGTFDVHSGWRVSSTLIFNGTGGHYESKIYIIFKLSESSGCCILILFA
jgi:hypothetical protein